MLTRRYVLNLAIRSRLIPSIGIRSLSTGMALKRKAGGDVKPTAKARKKSEPEVDYCDVEPQRAADGSIVWPAAPEAMERGTHFLKEWYDVPFDLRFQF